MKAAVGGILLAASLAAMPAAADIRVWTERDRQGEGRLVRGSVRDLKNFRFDDRISSLQADERWQVCSEPLFRGDCRWWKARCSTCGTGAEQPDHVHAQGARRAAATAPPVAKAPPTTDRVSALTRYGGAGRAAPGRAARRAAEAAAAAPSMPAPLPREWWEGGQDGAIANPPQLEVFERPNYQGRRLRLEEAVADLARLEQPGQHRGARRLVESVLATPFRGHCQTLDPKSEGLPKSPSSVRYAPIGLTDSPSERTVTGCRCRRRSSERADGQAASRRVRRVVLSRRTASGRPGGDQVADAAGEGLCSVPIVLARNSSIGERRSLVGSRRVCVTGASASPDFSGAAWERVGRPIASRTAATARAASLRLLCLMAETYGELRRPGSAMFLLLWFSAKMRRTRERCGSKPPRTAGSGSSPAPDG